MRRTVLAMVVACVVALGVAQVAAAAPQGVPVESGRATIEMFPTPDQCGCHSTFVEQWSQSMHAQALTDPIFNTKVAEADKATNGALGPVCRTCHGPAATMTGEIARGGQLSANTANGIGCMFCHQVDGIKDGRPGNTSHLVKLDGVRRAQLKDPAAPHPAAYSEIQEKAEFCGACHNVDHPVNGMHLESTYDEWKAGPYAAQGVVCQDCHMSTEPGVIGPTSGQAAGGAKQRDNIYQMTFVGGQVALGPSEVAIARLKSAAEVKLEGSDIVAPGESAAVTVTIANVGAGHYLPTGLTEVRQMWLEVFSVDGAGKKTKVGERVFGTILQDDKGNAPVELWEATKIKSDDRIPPKGSVTATYTFEMPQGTDATTLTAALYYKSAPDELAKKAGVENPTTEMAAATLPVYGTQAAKDAAAQEDVKQDSGFDMLNLAIALAALVVIAGIIVFFVRQSKKSA